MTALALCGPTLNTPPGRASGDAEFLAACERRDYALLQAALLGMTTREAVDHLACLFPHRTRRWFLRHLHTIRTMTADDFARFLDYADPTGETATARVLQERTGR
ncbi:MAG: hypothetical protein Q4F65_00935 [Propionibacteriaceae bacterium]|nr:hypothetical protein [Propionibacteriaceae bacterium]